MSTKTKIIVASILLLGSASVAYAEDPEADVYHLRAPSAGSYARHYVPPYASNYGRYASARDRYAAIETYWRKRSNSH